MDGDQYHRLERRCAAIETLLLDIRAGRTMPRDPATLEERLLEEYIELGTAMMLLERDGRPPFGGAK